MLARCGKRDVYADPSLIDLPLRFMTREQMRGSTGWSRQRSPYLLVMARQTHGSLCEGRCGVDYGDLDFSIGHVEKCSESPDSRPSYFLPRLA